MGFFIGSFLDRKFKTDKIFLIIFIVLGFAAAVKETIYILKRVQKKLDGYFFIYSSLKLSFWLTLVLSLFFSYFLGRVLLWALLSGSLWNIANMFYLSG